MLRGCFCLRLTSESGPALHLDAALDLRALTTLRGQAQSELAERLPRWRGGQSRPGSGRYRSGKEEHVSGSNLWCSRVVALALTLLLACQPSLAQAGSGDWTRVQNLPVHSAVSVKTKAGAKYHGALVSVTADSLAIDSDEPAFPGRAVRRREFRREDVREIRRIARGTSMLTGAAIGGAAGAGIGIGLDATAKSHEYRGLMAFLMGALGAGLGVAIAHHHPLVKSKIYVAP